MRRGICGRRLSGRFLKKLFPLPDPVAHDQGEKEHGIIERGNDLIVVQHYQLTREGGSLSPSSGLSGRR